MLCCFVNHVGSRHAGVKSVVCLNLSPHAHALGTTATALGTTATALGSAAAAFGSAATLGTTAAALAAATLAANAAALGATNLDPNVLIIHGCRPSSSGTTTHHAGTWMHTGAQLAFVLLLMLVLLGSNDDSQHDEKDGDNDILDDGHHG
jgi:hypothetical protein